MKNYEEKDLLESYHIVSLAEKLTIVVIVILKNIQGSTAPTEEILQDEILYKWKN